MCVCVCVCACKESFSSFPSLFNSLQAVILRLCNSQALFNFQVEVMDGLIHTKVEACGNVKANKLGEVGRAGERHFLRCSRCWCCCIGLGVHVR